MDELLYNMLACPLCHGKLVLDVEHHELICKLDRLAFPVRNNIPVLLEMDARKLSDDE